jgi:hypothetical protein
MAPHCEARGVLAELEAQQDSESLLSTWEAVAGLTGVEALAGSLDLLLVHNLFAVEENRFGLAEFSDETYGARGIYRIYFGPHAFQAEAGWSTLAGGRDYAWGAEFSRYWLPWSGGILRAKLHGDSRVDQENPLLAGLGMRALSLRGSVNLTAGSWYVEATGGIRYVEGAADGDVDALLTDTDQVGDIPANRILSGYLFFYRTEWKLLTWGAFASLADSRRDFYRFLHRSPGPTDHYMAFPYDTPLEAFAMGGLVALDYDWGQRAGLPLGTWSAKITFPFHSSRRQFYQARSPMGIPMWEGYYTFKGDEPWSAEAKARIPLPADIGLTLSYRFFLKPYLEYGFFDSQSYRIHAFAIRLSRG